MTTPSATASRILIIDDSANIHQDIRKILAPPAVSLIAELEADLFGEPAPVGNFRIQFTIDSAYQGDDGVALLESALHEGSRYAVAFVDMRMPPGLDGLGTVEKLWRLDPKLQVVICTAYSDYSWSEIIQRLGRNDRLLILRKPFDHIEVLQLAHTLAEKCKLEERSQAQWAELQRQAAGNRSDFSELRTLLEILAERTDELITLVDVEYRGIYYSPSYAQWLGDSMTPKILRSIESQVHPEDGSALRAALARAFAGALPHRIRLRRKLHEIYVDWDAELRGVGGEKNRGFVVILEKIASL